MALMYDQYHLHLGDWVNSKVWSLSTIKHVYRFKCDKFKCSNKYPKQYLPIVSPRKEMGPHGERKKSLTPVGSNSRPPCINT